jgi:hypothetical protein
LPLATLASERAAERCTGCWSGAGGAASGVARHGVRQRVVNYQGWAPAAGILPPVPQDLPDRQARSFRAHIVYGAALGWLRSRLDR